VDADAGLIPVQLRFKTGLTGADYVTREAWREARLLHCPLHPRGGCGFVRHGTYERKSPAGTLIARWYCPQGHRTFSLLPDHLAARFPGTLSEIERVVATLEQARSLEAAADALRSDPVTLASAVRWVRRRVRPVRALLTVLVGLFPQFLLGCAPTVGALRGRLSCEQVLLLLRELAQVHLQALAYPLGFHHRLAACGEHQRGIQQRMGPDPPPHPA
jgi:transposase-like protein